MQKNRVVFDFGSTYFTIYGDERVLLRRPAALIVKRSLRPVAVAIGEAAVKMRYGINEDEMFLRPVMKGAVSHKFGCALLVKEYLSEACGRFSNPSVCVLIGCGLNPEQKLEIERTFIDAGYTDIFLMESLLGLVPYLKERNIKAAAIIGGETTEIGLFEGGKLISGYSLDVGANTVNERIKDFVKENYKLIISDESAEELKINASSLYSNDLSKCAVTGSDALTGRGKRLVLTARELHSEVLYVYGRILKVIDAALLAAPIETARTVAGTGILFTGYGSLQVGFRDFTTKTLKVPATIVGPEENVVFSGALCLSSQEDFMSSYLRLEKNA